MCPLDTPWFPPFSLKAGDGGKLFKRRGRAQKRRKVANSFSDLCVFGLIDEQGIWVSSIKNRTRRFLDRIFHPKVLRAKPATLEDGVVSRSPSVENINEIFCVWHGWVGSALKPHILLNKNMVTSLRIPFVESLVFPPR